MLNVSNQTNDNRKKIERFVQKLGELVLSHFASVLFQLN